MVITTETFIKAKLFVTLMFESNFIQQAQITNKASKSLRYYAPMTYMYT